MVLGILAVIVLILVIVFWPRGGGAPAPGPTGTDDTSLSPTDGATPSPTTTAGGACDPSRVTITADTDKNEYAAGELPQLWFTLENKTSQPCSILIGDTDMVYAITSPSGSGDEQYWSTADCAKTEQPAPVAVTLKPGVPVPSDKISWPRTRSTPGDCAATEPLVGAEGASFDFSVSVAGLSATKRFYLY
ncbi:MAG: hypothetical protein J7480_03635 [Microbacteriaceae bacterium]|nr:hypothetical protein [Microbacteriaceae bacterium]